MSYITLTNGMRTPVGSVLTGTVNPAHTIPALAAWCDYYNHEAYLALLERSRIDDDLQRYLDGQGDKSTADDADVDWLLDELFNCAQDVLPDGYYFGARWGDGADLGLWSEDE